MASLISWIKKELEYLKESFMEILNGFIIFILVSSGLGSALLLRYTGYNGTIITFVSIIIEFASLSICYFLFKRYLKQPEEKQSSKQRSDKS